MDKQWMKDPLRYAMEARLSGKKRFALGAVLTLVFLLAAVKLCAAMEGAAVIALDGCVLCSPSDVGRVAQAE